MHTIYATLRSNCHGPVVNK